VNTIVFHLVNYTLSFLMYLIVGREVLLLIIGDPQNIMLLAFAKVTEPVYTLTRKLLPFARGRWVPVLSLLLLFAVRVAVFLVLRPATNR